ncbi:MAG: FAD-binding oxidoreductase [Gammaproteobacteria bacterium]|nr:FAD-binding oxidoreductase [Gammaproteobacteria bacterium]
MRRWNSWGDDAQSMALPDGALSLLKAELGAPSPLADAELGTILARVPASRLPVHALVDGGAEARLRHARGHSLRDWLALRSGELGPVPDGVAYPTDSAQVRTLLDWATAQGVRVIPYGGGTSVVGHLDVPEGGGPVLCLSLERLNGLLSLDPVARLARFGAGIAGPELEAALKARGFRLGHYPQSFEYSTLGGWVVTRSSGQQSLGYGRIEQLFAGGRMETPIGRLEIPTIPASGAGTDLRELVLGSEGRLGVLTEAVVRISPLPELEAFHAFAFASWEQAVAAVRALAQARIPLSMLRLSNAEETRVNLKLAGHETAIAWLERYLAWRGAGVGKCLLFVGISGTRGQARASRTQAFGLLRQHGALALGRKLGEKWKAGRYRAPYLRETLWRAGYAVDTLETAADWPRLPGLIADVEQSLRTGLTAEGVPVLAFTHLSHFYPQGASAYTTYVYPVATSYAETLGRWRRLKAAASEAIVRHGGTISHQHGVGVDHKPYLQAEKGELGLEAMRTLFARFDPAGLMNPGKLVD